MEKKIALPEKGYGVTPLSVSVLFNPALAWNQRSGRMGAQPVRFSARNPGLPMQLCLASSAAADLFRGRVCMTSDAVDASYAESETPQMSQWKSEFNLHFKAPFSRAQIATSQSLPYSMFITDSAIKIRNGEFCGKEPFRAFKLSTSAHVAIALWDMSDGALEVFDASGSDPESKRTIFQQSLLRTLFSKHPGPKPTRVKFVNTEQLQEREAMYCQTWIYWYLYERAINQKSAAQTLQLAQKLHPQQRADMIRSFWHFLLK
jgi:hypothetical protein